jgi:6,7-dimethyl-8-ribityllumazine synthase
MPHVIDADLTTAAAARYAIVVGRFNELITDRLRDGAVATLRAHGVPSENIVVAHVPGAWELPTLARRFAESGRYDAVIGIGCVIRGSTPHFDYVAGEAAKGLGQVSAATGVPVAFGVLTTETIEQAIERAGTKLGNKGGEAAIAAMETVAVVQAVDALHGEPKGA